MMTAAKLARLAARDAHTNLFESHRGVYEVEGPVLARPTVVYYNNHPYEGSPTRREEETAKLMEALKEAGIEELAYATYPVSGEQAGYTFAMVLGAGPEQTELTGQKLAEVIKESWEKVK
jgi:hypothetical protein